MEYEEVTIEGFSVVGVSIRTTNKDDQSERDIRKLRMEFLLNNIADDIHNRVSDDIYCIYVDFDGKKDGEYTAILGYRVSNTNDDTGEYAYGEVAGGKYYKFVSEGEVPQCARPTWEYIWNSDINRKYLTDFDVFGETAIVGSKKGQVITYISVE
jgi:predicted transcriptional regulator YdeE